MNTNTFNAKSKRPPKTGILEINLVIDLPKTPNNFKTLLPPIFNINLLIGLNIFPLNIELKPFDMNFFTKFCINLNGFDNSLLANLPNPFTNLIARLKSFIILKGFVNHLNPSSTPNIFRNPPSLSVMLLPGVTSSDIPVRAVSIPNVTTLSIHLKISPATLTILFIVSLFSGLDIQSKTANCNISPNIPNISPNTFVVALLIFLPIPNTSVPPILLFFFFGPFFGVNFFPSSVTLLFIFFCFSFKFKIFLKDSNNSLSESLN